MTTQPTNPRKLRGTVVSTKMKDTIVLAIESFVKHPKYHKFLKRTKKYSAHDEGNTCKEGDIATIVETKPISKSKRFRVEK